MRKFNVCTPRPKQEGGSWWHTIGNAAENDKGQIIIYLNSQPFPDAAGDCKIMLFEKDEQKKPGPPEGGWPGADEKTDDQIPF